MKRKLSALFTAFLISLTFFSALVSADAGPKDSLVISFHNIEADTCYCTLLSKYESSGFYHTSNTKSDNEIPKAFQSYKDLDGFFYLENYALISGSKEFIWDYTPPQTFKVLFYFPKTQKYAVSGIIEKAAFNARYSVDMQGIDITADNLKIQVTNENTPIRVLFSFLVRVFVTILIELVIAILFNYKSKNQVITILTANIITQVLLNILLNKIYIDLGAFFMLLLYIPLEIMAFIAESVVYCIFLKSSEKAAVKAANCVLYSFLANLASFIGGVIISAIFPWF